MGQVRPWLAGTETCVVVRKERARMLASAMRGGKECNRQERNGNWQLAIGNREELMEGPDVRMKGTQEREGIPT
jgi:hypothetical protein